MLNFDFKVRLFSPLKGDRTILSCWETKGVGVEEVIPKGKTLGHQGQKEEEEQEKGMKRSR